MWKFSNLIKVLTTLILIYGTASFGNRAAAQDTGNFIVLDELIIYGAKDTNALEDTSSSVGVVTAERIDEYQLMSFRDAFRQLANVMDADWNDAGFLIRGVNSEGFVPGGAPLSSVYIDGVQQTVNGARRGARGLWDVEQVEVYRGPQSTLSGRAALAGAIYVKTKDPVFEKQAELSGTIGNNEMYGTALMLNAPIVQDELAFRFAAAFDQSESDLNYPNYERFDRFDDFSHDTYYNLRGKLLYQPKEMPGTKALLSYAFSHDAPDIDDIGGPLLGFDYDDWRGDLNDPPVFSEARSNDVHNVGLEVTHDFSDALRLTSLTGFTHSLMDRPSVNEGTEGETDVMVGNMEDQIATQEVRLNYEAGKWKWVGGLYGSYEEFDAYFDRQTFGSRFDQSRSTRETANLAAFGEATYEFLPSWKATLGGRVDYTEQQSTEFFSRQTPLGGTTTVLTDFAAELEELNLIPKVGLSKDLTDSQTIGVTYSEGFRTGGSGFDQLNLETYTYEPETASTYEGFYKGSFLNDRLTLNANVFYTEFSDQQVEVVIQESPRLTRIFNAASSTSYGFEIEPSFKVNERLSLFASIGYVHTQFEDFDSAAALGNLSGYPFPEAPEWSVAIGGQYTFANGFYIGGDVKYTSSYLSAFGVLGAPHDWIDERTIVNVQAGYRTERWELNLFAENLLNEEYYVFQDGDLAATLGERLSYGVNVKAKF